MLEIARILEGVDMNYTSRFIAFTDASALQHEVSDMCQETQERSTKYQNTWNDGGYCHNRKIMSNSIYTNAAT